MRPCLEFAVAMAVLASSGLAQSPSAGPYKVVKTAKVGGAGGYDYVYADGEGRRLYIARTGPMSRMTVYNLDTLEPAGEISTTNSHGAVVDSKSHHGFISSKPILMFDSQTMMPIKKIEVEGNPDGMLFDPSQQRAYILSHAAPHVTVIDAKDGSLVGTIDLGGMPEQAVVVHGVPGAAAGPGPGEIAGALQVGHDGLDGTLGEPDDGDSQRRRRQNHHYSADRHRHRWRIIQSAHDGSFQLAWRRYADDH